ncbi:tRNA-dihydrouridine(20) synthase [NAD(P)+] [Podospora fimiseda]|uniref:tRNA-dihydrouridine(20) synthase [NAD(P)+] n=1 Tax=Podospora fimiseda TaxID=252190 RepID=A0AAN7BVQ6_9PEZI|nr:tRNA-dihydrouridine(20) synthase [NAD(P)+] [Podospora fimiseda]
MATTSSSDECPPPPPPSFVPIPPLGVDYRQKIVLAPMVRSGELPSRLLALHYGADLVWGPETVDHSMIGTTRRVNPRTDMIEFTREPSNNNAKASAQKSPESIIYRLDPVREAKKLIFQIGTSDPDRAVAAAKLVARDVAGIDVNAGCPKPFSTSGGMGAALLRTPDKLVAILENLVKHIVPEFQIGISVKIRLLETAPETEALVRRLVKTGITGLTIHCRTTPMRPREKAIRGQLKMIADVCREAGVACLVNGDVENRDHGLELAKEFGCDGAMIATCAEKNPSCFRSKEAGGMETWREAVEKYLRFAMEVENKMANTKFMLTQMVPGREGVYKQMQGCRSYVAFVELFRFDELKQMAKEADRILELGAYEKPPEPKKKVKQVQKENGAGEKKRKREEGDDQEGEKKKQTVVIEEKEIVVPEALGVGVGAAAVSV